MKTIIKNYLDNRAKTDELFARAYAKPNKSIDECVKYIMGEASKLGNAVCVEDSVVYGWAVHYYDEDSIKITPVHNAHAVATPKVELTEEEKAEAHKQALQDYKNSCVERMWRENTAKKTKKATTTKVELSTPSLFD